MAKKEDSSKLINTEVTLSKTTKNKQFYESDDGTINMYVSKTELPSDAPEILQVTLSWKS